MLARRQPRQNQFKGQNRAQTQEEPLPKEWLFVSCTGHWPPDCVGGGCFHRTLQVFSSRTALGGPLYGECSCWNPAVIVVGFFYPNRLSLAPFY